jgi:hypothetical protein
MKHKKIWSKFKNQKTLPGQNIRNECSWWTTPDINVRQEGFWDQWFLSKSSSLTTQFSLVHMCYEHELNTNMNIVCDNLKVGSYFHCSIHKWDIMKVLWKPSKLMADKKIVSNVK